MPLGSDGTSAGSPRCLGTGCFKITSRVIHVTRLVSLEIRFPRYIPIAIAHRLPRPTP
jgi:hypothetical protein